MPAGKSLGLRAAAICGRTEPGPALRRITIIAAFVVLVSSVWLVAVDSAGSLVSKRWREAGRGIDASWLTDLAFHDPRLALMAGERCTAVASDPQTCREYFERALAGNRRISGAEMALILLAERRGESGTATRMLERLKAHDKGFAARWLEWNFYLRNGPPDRFREGAEGILRHAPANFRGDFPLLRLTGMPSDAVVQTMLASGSAGRALEYAASLAEEGDSGSADPLLGLLGRVDRGLARETALRFVAEQLGHRRGFEPAARVWAEAVKSGLIPDRRRSRDDDAILNSNPRLRLPFVPRSFDWSAAENRWATVSSAGEDGLRVEFRSDAPEGMPLLSKLILLPEGTESVRIRMRTERMDRDEPMGEIRNRRAVWQLYDAVLNRVIVKSHTEGEPCGEDCRVFDLPTGGAENSGAIFVNLAVGKAEGAGGELRTFEVTEVEFETLP